MFLALQSCSLAVRYFHALNGFQSNRSVAKVDPGCNMEKLCDAGERMYFKMYRDVKLVWEGSAFTHYLEKGKEEGRKYICYEQCSEGERIYTYMYPDIQGSWEDSAFSHFLQYGTEEGRVYICTNHTPGIEPTMESTWEPTAELTHEEAI